MSFQQGLSGLNASSKALDTIGNNIANSGTVGYKSSNAEFADVFAASLAGAGSSLIGLGTKVAAVVQEFTQGNVTVTNDPLDLAINGGGFFRLQNTSGDIVFSRNGQFQLDKDGYIVNASGQQLTGYAADVNGNINPPLVPLRLFDPALSSDAAPQATGTSTAATGVQANINLDSREGVPSVSPFDYQDARTYNKSTAVTIYDSLGNPHVYSLYFVKTATNTWNTYATVSNPSGATTAFTNLGLLTTVANGGPLTFDTDGSILSGGTPTAAITAAQLGYPTGVDDMSFDVNFNGTTQYGSAFSVNSLTQDGFTSGKLAGFNIASDGTILGKYTNGQSRNLGQVIMANFRNPQGLQPLGNNVWQATSAAGTELDGYPGSSGQFGPLQSSALEDSNVDLTSELVALITQQRAYQANAQTIKTQDSILQTLVNL